MAASSPETVRSRKDNGNSAAATKSPKGRPPKNAGKKSSKGNETKTARESTVKLVCYSLLFAILAVAGSIVLLKGVSLHEDYFASRLAAKESSAAESVDEAVDEQPIFEADSVDDATDSDGPVADDSDESLVAETVEAVSADEPVDDDAALNVDEPGEAAADEVEPEISDIQDDSTVEIESSEAALNVELADASSMEAAVEDISDEEPAVIEAESDESVVDIPLVDAPQEELPEQPEPLREEAVAEEEDSLPEPVVEEEAPLPENAVEEEAPASEPVVEEEVTFPESVVEREDPVQEGQDEVEADEHVAKNEASHPEPVVEEGAPLSEPGAEQKPPLPEPKEEEDATHVESVVEDEAPLSELAVEEEAPLLEPIVEEEAPQLEPGVEEEAPQPEPMVEEEAAPPEPAVEEEAPLLESVVEEEAPLLEPVVEEEAPLPEPVVEEEAPLPEPAVEEEAPIPEPVVEEEAPPPEPVVEEESPLPEPVVEEEAPLPEPVIEEEAPPQEPLVEVEVAHTDPLVAETIEPMESSVPSEEISEPKPGPAVVIPDADDSTPHDQRQQPRTNDFEDAGKIEEKYSREREQITKRESGISQEIETQSAVPIAVEIKDSLSSLVDGEVDDSVNTVSDETDIDVNILPISDNEDFAISVGDDFGAAAEAFNEEVESDSGVATEPVADEVAEKVIESAAEDAIAPAVADVEEAVEQPSAEPLNERSKEETKMVENSASTSEDEIADETVVVVAAGATSRNVSSSSDEEASSIPADAAGIPGDAATIPADAATIPADESDPYHRRDTTNDSDFLIRSTLDALEDKLFRAKEGGDEEEEKEEEEEEEGGGGSGGGVEAVLKEFDSLLAMYPSSPRALWGRARCLDALADAKRSNALLEEGIEAYEKVVDGEGTPPALILLAGKRLVNRLQFRGKMGSAIKVQKRLLAAQPGELGLLTDLGILYELAERSELSRPIFEKVLDLDPSNPLASVYLGYMIHKKEPKSRKAIELLVRGVNSNAPGTQVHRFYSALGDSLVRVGHRKEAESIYEDGVKENLFIDKYQRPLYKDEVYDTKTWWTEDGSGVKELLTALKSKWRSIREEALKVARMEKFFTPVMERLVMTGGVKEFPLFFRGGEAGSNCHYAPETCDILGRFPDLLKCSRCQIKFQMLLPNTYVWPHCGSTNSRLRMQLGLMIPSAPDTRKELRVGLPDSGVDSWKEGEFLIFDDSFEQEIWVTNPAVPQGVVDETQAVLLLSVDVWHPNLDQSVRDTLGPLPF